MALLSAVKVEQVKATDKVQRLHDGDGLYLTVFPNGSKTWHFRYRFNNGPKMLTLGHYTGNPRMTLDAARKALTIARGKVAGGNDPKQEKHEAKKANVAQAVAKAVRADVMTFGKVTTEWLATKTATNAKDKNKIVWSKRHDASIVRS